MKNLFLSLYFVFLFGCTTPLPTNTNQHTSLYLDQSVMSGLDFQGKEITSVKIEKDWYYVLPSGKAISVILDEEGKIDHFQEGLARTRVNGKIGFFDQTLDIVLQPQYDYAFPFHDGVSEICMGCQEAPSNGSKMLDGGTWKRVDRTGLVLEEE